MTNEDPTKTQRYSELSVRGYRQPSIQPSPRDFPQQDLHRTGVAQQPRAQANHPDDVDRPNRSRPYIQVSVEQVRGVISALHIRQAAECQLGIGLVNSSVVIDAKEVHVHTIGEVAQLSIQRLDPVAMTVALDRIEARRYD